MPRSIPKELTATATPTTAQLMRSGLCQEPDQPQPDPASSHTLAVSTSVAAVSPGDGGHEPAEDVVDGQRPYGD
jgi:hypothetical protein